MSLPSISNGNGSFSSWVLGIVAALILAAIVGSILVDRDVAKVLGEHEERLKYLSTRIDEKTVSRFTRDDFEREMRNRDNQQQRIEHRLELIEQSKR